MKSDVIQSTQALSNPPTLAFMVEKPPVATVLIA